jgi:hypothetical protein
MQLLLIPAKACSHVACKSLTRTAFACNDSNNAHSIFVVRLGEEDETATQGLPPINQWNNQLNEQLKNMNNEQ